MKLEREIPASCDNLSFNITLLQMKHAVHLQQHGVPEPFNITLLQMKLQLTPELQAPPRCFQHHTATDETHPTTQKRTPR